MQNFDEGGLKAQQEQQRVLQGSKYTTIEAYRLEQERVLDGASAGQQASGLLARLKNGLSRLLKRR